MGSLTSRRASARTIVAGAAVSMAIVGFWRGGLAVAETTPEIVYSGDNGPGFWGDVAGWEACSGTSATARQSPIDIDRFVVDPRLAPLRLQLHETPLALTNNGHSIEQEYEPGSTLALDGTIYDLTQFHFHTLSEHTVAGRHGVMELHAVFADPASDKKAVVGMLYVIGKSNRFISALLADGLPKKSGDEISDPAKDINVGAALTNTARYYTYQGSLTTPPCSETVTWLVLRDFAELSKDQFEAFRTILGNDFRPLQRRNGRTVRSSVNESGREH
jgi:carbonic anhydrase